jgi:peptide/nickel transport system substrate-binding protein
MQFRRKIRLGMTIGAAASAISLGLIAPTLSGASSQFGTITQAEGAGASPNYIFPMYPGADCTVANTSQFQALMFRPLYWFGFGQSALIQPKLSTALLPKYSNGNKTVTITMKGWKFADGQTVNAESVMFFLNMYRAVPSGFCTYTPKTGIPDQVASAHAVGTTKVVINLKNAVNPTWFTYNNLAVITPLPNSWDYASAGQKSNCAAGKFGASSTNVACKNVNTYLNALGANTSTFTGKLWQSGVDGPWRLTQFDNLGNATFVPNSKYSGPQKAQVAFFKEVAFTTTQAEENQLQAGNIDLGGVDPSILTSPATAPGKTGPNWGQLASRYNMVGGIPYSTNYDNINFGGPSPNAAFIGQEYVRQAMQETIDQPGIIAKAFKNYAVEQFNALPYVTPTSLAGKLTNPFPYNPTAGETLMTSHGWTNTGGQLTCTSPGSGASQCGAGIASGYKASINFEWISGTASLDTENNAIVADWNTLGINVNHSEVTFNAIFGQCPLTLAPKSTYDVCSWGGGWLFAPDYLPTGEPLWLTGAGSNYGGYSSATMDSLIKATLSQNIKLTAYANYSATDLPEFWVPNNTASGEVIKTLKSSHGLGFFNTLETYMPEYFHY